MRAFDGLPDRAQNGRVVRVAERGQIRVLPVHGQQILRQIVRADGEEVALGSQLVRDQHSAGVSIMVPTSMFWPIFTPSAVSSARHSSRTALASCSSRRLVIMGNMMLMLP